MAFCSKVKTKEFSFMGKAKAFHGILKDMSRPRPRTYIAVNHAVQKQIWILYLKCD